MNRLKDQLLNEQDEMALHEEMMDNESDYNTATSDDSDDSVYKADFVRTDSFKMEQVCSEDKQAEEKRPLKRPRSKLFDRVLNTDTQTKMPPPARRRLVFDHFVVADKNDTVASSSSSLV